MTHSTTGEKYAGETHTNPLEQSQWSIGRGDTWIYFDFELLPDETCLLHAAIDSDGRGQASYCEDFEKLTVPVSDREYEAANLVARAWVHLKELLQREPQGRARARAFIRAVQEAE